jgi:calcium-dependent protein kinase
MITLINTPLKDYELEYPPLGQGTFGTVYRAKHKVLGATFAVKELHQIFEDPYLTISALREIEVMR